MAVADLTAERLRELVTYDPDVGVFIRNDVRGRGRPRYTGLPAGHIVKGGNRAGYIVIGLDGFKGHYAHRLAWLYVHGAWPRGVIDHLNGNKSDNRICNLRDVPQNVNTQNQRSAPISKTSGLPLGVYFFKRTGRWMAGIQVDGKAKHLGYFDCPNEAHQAYLVAKRSLHEGCTI